MNPQELNRQKFLASYGDEDQLNIALKSRTNSVILSALKNDLITPKHLDSLFHAPVFGRWAVKHKAATEQQLDDIISTGSQDHRDAALSNPNVNKKTLQNALDSNITENQKSALKNPNVTKEQLDIASSNIKLLPSVLRHNNATDEHFELAVANPDPRFKLIVSEQRKTPKHVFEQLFRDTNPLVRMNIINNNLHVTKENLSKAVYDRDPDVRMAVYDHEKATHDHFKVGFEDPNPRVQEHATRMWKYWN